MKQQEVRLSRLALVVWVGAVAAFAGALADTAHADVKDRLVIDLAGEPSSLDPHMQWNPDSYYVYRNIFDNLYTRDDNGEIRGVLVEDHAYLDETRILLTIREGVRFHDGTPLTAEDAAYSIRRIFDPALGSPQTGQFNKIVDARAVDRNHVELTTDGPYPALFDQLVKLSVVPMHYVEAVGGDAFNRQPMGSGPYRFMRWRRGVDVTLTRNSDYWGDIGGFETVVFRAVPDMSTRVANLRSGASDLVVGLNADIVRQLHGRSGLKILTVNTTRVAYLRLNTLRPPLDDSRIRRAIAHAVDKEAIVAGLLDSYAEPSDVMVTPEQFGWARDVPAPAYDPGQARALVKAAGGAAKRPLVFATAPVFDARIVQALQQMLSDAGLDVRIETTDMANYLARVRDRGAQAPHLNFGRWSCACRDADNVLYPLLHSSSEWSAVLDGDLDAALETARGTLDADRRLRLYSEIHRRVAAESLLVPLYQTSVIYGARADLEWRPTPDESMFLNRMGWAP